MSALEEIESFAPWPELLAVYEGVPGPVLAAALTEQMSDEIMTKAREMRAAIWSKH